MRALTDALGCKKTLPASYVQMKAVDAEVRGLRLPTAMQV